jgi:hypothetical protein
MRSEEWINILDDSNDNQRAHSEIINRYLWRSKDQQKELIVVFDDPSGRVRYKYFGVSENLYEELLDRTFNPNIYKTPIDKWFLRNISEKHKFQTYTSFKDEEDK